MPSFTRLSLQSHTRPAGGCLRSRALANEGTEDQSCSVAAGTVPCRPAPHHHLHLNTPVLYTFSWVRICEIRLHVLRLFCIDTSEGTVITLWGFFFFP